MTGDQWEGNTSWPPKQNVISPAAMPKPRGCASARPMLEPVVEAEMSAHTEPAASGRAGEAMSGAIRLTPKTWTAGGAMLSRIHGVGRETARNDRFKKKAEVAASTREEEKTMHADTRNKDARVFW